jgi:helicase
MKKTQVASSVLETAHGSIAYPAYIPVTTFGAKYPLDDLIRPYLPRLAPALMVSYHYAKQMKVRPELPLLIDSGGFASLFKGAKIRKRGGVGILEVPKEGGGTDILTPGEVLAFQEANADVAFTLDFPIPPSMSGRDAKLRRDLTISNAYWALENRRSRTLKLFACIQGLDFDGYVDCAKELAKGSFDGFAVGGMVPRVSDRKELLRIVEAIRSIVGDRPLHVLGLGKPELTQQLFAIGVQSVDSSSYVKLAADGKLWNQPEVSVPDASPLERLQFALINLASAGTFRTPSNMPCFRYGGIH